MIHSAEKLKLVYISQKIKRMTKTQSVLLTFFPVMSIIYIIMPIFFFLFIISPCNRYSFEARWADNEMCNYVLFSEIINFKSIANRKLIIRKRAFKTQGNSD